MDDEKRSRLICELSDSDRLGTPSPTSTFSSSPIPSPKSSSPPIPSPKSSSQPPSSSSSSSDGVTSSYQPQPPSSSAKLIDEDDLEGSLLSFVQSLKDNVRTEKGINCSDLDVLQQRWILLASSLAQTGGDRTVVRKSFSELCNLVWDGLAEKKNDRDMYLGGLKPLLGKLNQLQLTFPNDCQQRFSQMMKRCNLRCAGGEDFAFIKLLVVVRADPCLPDNDNSKQLLALLNKKEVVYDLCPIDYSVVPPTVLGDSKGLWYLSSLDPIDQVPMIIINDEQSIYEFSSIMKKIEDTFIDKE